MSGKKAQPVLVVQPISLLLGLALIRGSWEERIPAWCERAACVTQQSRASGFPKAGRGVASPPSDSKHINNPAA